jgi:hypothetical protein
MVRDLQKLHAKTVKIHSMVEDPSIGGFKMVGNDIFWRHLQLRYKISQDIEMLKNSLDAVKQTVVEIEEEQVSSTKTLGRG